MAATFGQFPANFRFSGALVLPRAFSISSQNGCMLFSTWNHFQVSNMRSKISSYTKKVCESLKLTNKGWLPISGPVVTGLIYEHFNRGIQLPL